LDQDAWHQRDLPQKINREGREASPARAKIAKLREGNINLISSRNFAFFASSR
jgi:hypothetical protein